MGIRGASWDFVANLLRFHGDYEFYMLFMDFAAGIPMEFGEVLGGTRINWKWR